MILARVDEKRTDNFDKMRYECLLVMSKFDCTRGELFALTTSFITDLSLDMMQQKMFGLKDAKESLIEILQEQVTLITDTIKSYENSN